SRLMMEKPTPFSERRQEVPEAKEPWQPLGRSLNPSLYLQVELLQNNLRQLTCLLILQAQLS
ncbi:Hypothetical predicted protein, partial [Marmota monax]